MEKLPKDNYTKKGRKEATGKFERKVERSPRQNFPLRQVSATTFGVGYRLPPLRSPRLHRVGSSAGRDVGTISSDER